MVELCKLQDDVTIRILSGQELKLQMEGYHMTDSQMKNEVNYKKSVLVLERLLRACVTKWGRGWAA